MAASFNVGSFNAIDTSETKKSKSSKSSKSGGSNNELRKKLILFGGIILGIVVVIALVLFLLSVFMTPTYTYDDIENIMVNAAEAYFEDNPKRLPQSESQRVEIDIATLAASEYMDPMTEYMGEDTSCDGQITVQTNGDGYMYVPRLDCGDDYVTQSLSEVVTSDIVTEGYGLYQVGDTYVYRGHRGCALDGKPAPDPPAGDELYTLCGGSGGRKCKGSVYQPEQRSPHGNRDGDDGWGGHRENR